MKKSIDNNMRKYYLIDDYFLTANKGKIYPLVIRNTEKMVIEKALERTFGNKIAAAKILGINRNTLHSKIKKYNIDIERYKI